MKRIFTAIDISERARSEVFDYIEKLRAEFPNLRVGWERAEKLHLTLKFLGDLDEKQLQNLIKAVENAAKRISDFNLQVFQTGAFPAKRNARILWLGLKDETESLKKLNTVLESECAAKGFAKETRNFKAHLTIARLREPQKSKDLVERHLENEFKSAEFTISEIVIYQSLLQPKGSVYSVVSKHRFNEKLTADENR
jgi:2'-5' RNA ligase